TTAPSAVWRSSAPRRPMCWRCSSLRPALPGWWCWTAGCSRKEVALVGGVCDRGARPELFLPAGAAGPGRGDVHGGGGGAGGGGGRQRGGQDDAVPLPGRGAAGARDGARGRAGGGRSGAEAEAAGAAGGGVPEPGGPAVQRDGTGRRGVRAAAPGAAAWRGVGGGAGRAGAGWQV